MTIALPGGEPVTRFAVDRRNCARLGHWFQWYPGELMTPSDRRLAQEFADAVRGVHLVGQEARLVRAWYDHIPATIEDPSDAEYAERLDAFLDDI